MDVEGAEWKAIPDMLANDDLRNVKQFCFELHVGARPSLNRLKDAFEILRTLEERGFRKFHYDPNLNNVYMSPRTLRIYATCHEMYYVNTNFNKQ